MGDQRLAKAAAQSSGQGRGRTGIRGVAGFEQGRHVGAQAKGQVGEAPEILPGCRQAVQRPRFVDRPALGPGQDIGIGQGPTLEFAPQSTAQLALPV